MRVGVGRRFGIVFGLGCAGLMAWFLARHGLARKVDIQEDINVELGIWASRFLVAALAISPISRWLKEPVLKRWRRPLGLAAVAFATAHAVQWSIYTSAWPAHLVVVVKRPYLVIGLISLLLLVPMALTSNSAAIRRIGPRRWKSLHRAVYPAALLMVIHSLMGWGDPMKEPGLHAVLIAALLTLRAGPLLSPAAKPYRQSNSVLVDEALRTGAALAAQSRLVGRGSEG